MKRRRLAPAGKIALDRLETQGDPAPESRRKTPVSLHILPCLNGIDRNTAGARLGIAIAGSELPRETETRTMQATGARGLERGSLPAGVVERGL